MSLLSEYITNGIAGVAAYAGDDLVGDWPSMDLRWDGARQVFGWFWANDDKPHVFKVDRIAEDDYQVILYHANGRIELGPIWNTEQEAMLERWQDSPLRLPAADALDALMASAVGPIVPVAGGDPQPYQVMVEWAPLEDGPERWAPVGAWAANETAVAFYALPRYTTLRGLYADILAASMAPLEIFEYVWQSANGYTEMRGKIGEVMAITAEEAAITAASQAQEFRTG